MRSRSILVLLLAFWCGRLATPRVGYPQQLREATDAARVWLALIDAGKYAEGWQAAADTFRRAVDTERFEAAMAAFRPDVGAVVSREPRSIALPRGVDGGIVAIEFQTSFQHHELAGEFVTVVMEEGHGWRVGWYLARPETEPRPAVGIDPLHAVTMAEQAAASAAAEAWLELADARDYRGSWEAASPRLRSAKSLAEWEEMLKSLHSAFGASRSRDVMSVTYTTRAEDLPDGRYFAFFLGSAASPSGATPRRGEGDTRGRRRHHETVVLEETAAGEWQVVGYFAQTQQRIGGFGGVSRDAAGDTPGVSRRPREAREAPDADPQSSLPDDVRSARERASAWLALLDAADYRQAWTNASPRLREGTDFETWSAYVGAGRASFAALESREPMAIDLGTPSANRSERDTLELEFVARFAGGARMLEHVTLVRDADGSWMVAGYDYREGQGG